MPNTGNKKVFADVMIGALPTKGTMELTASFFLKWLNIKNNNNTQ